MSNTKNKKRTTKNINTNQQNNDKKCCQKIKSFFNYDRTNLFISIGSLLFAIFAIILSYNANSFSKETSPLTYSYEFVKNDALNLYPSIDSDVYYNISDIVIDINNNPGKISKAYIAQVGSDENGNDFADIRCCERDSDTVIVFDDNFALKYRYVDKSRTAKLSIGFNDFNKDKYGHFFIIFKSYSGDYYYNIVHYITDDERYYDETTGFYFVDTNTNFLDISDIYNRNEIALLCDDINHKDYVTHEINMDEYTNQLENEYKLLKDKLEG